jgi:hypothetical protein
MKLISVVFGLSVLSGSAEACKQVTMTPNYLNFWANGWEQGTICNISQFTPPWNTLLGMQLGPGKGHFAWEYEDKQYGSVYFQIGNDGKGRIVFFYSNMKQVDGDTFGSQVEFLNANGEVVGYSTSVVGVNARQERTDIKPVSATPEYWRSITAIRFRHWRINSVDDEALWEGARAAAAAACAVYVPGCQVF